MSGPSKKTQAPPPPRELSQLDLFVLRQAVEIPKSPAGGTVTVAQVLSQVQSELPEIAGVVGPKELKKPIVFVAAALRRLAAVKIIHPTWSARDRCCDPDRPPRGYTLGKLAIRVAIGLRRNGMPAEWRGDKWDARLANALERARAEWAAEHPAAAKRLAEVEAREGAASVVVAPSPSGTNQGNSITNAARRACKTAESAPQPRNSASVRCSQGLIAGDAT